MINNKTPYSNEFKVGIFVLIGFLFIFILGIFFTRNLFHNNLKEYSIIFQYLNGLNITANVKFAGGIKIGKIKSIEAYHNKTKIIVGIDEKYHISNKSEFRITSDSMLGEKYINMTTSDNDQKKVSILPEGSVIEGKEAIGVDKLLKTVTDLAEKISTMVIPLSTMFESIATSGDLVSSIKNLNTILSESSNIIIQNKANITNIISNIKQLIGKVDSGKGVLGVLINDKELSQDLKDSVRSLQTILDKIQNSSILGRSNNNNVFD